MVENMAVIVHVEASKIFVSVIVLSNDMKTFKEFLANIYE